ncbi:enoyl-CoA hydratase [Tsuneonella suprasediminis]|uniref:Enoyl-CoA hydratase n=1 Tax=Tsuneonella suprasediminis TaxID=2306996 RepID=A0A419R0I0_9SPHN|nr:crotonase/enoyl-CoA hydratase family protein [Tsuneonella suprasediminis]RJX66998.1 enoyl-CoA hydratase [Tsuneonella suprasediminis]
MDRYNDDLGESENPISVHGPALPLPDDDEALVARSTIHAAIPEGLFRLNELECLYEDDSETLWTYMAPRGRPSFTPPMLGDFENWQKYIGQGFGPGRVPLKFLVLGSRSPGVFCFGGDLALFQRLIQDEDRDGLVRYGHRCCAILYRNLHALEKPTLTIGLVEGAALGGGFEALLSFDYLIADRDATFGLPEVLFGLFPGMGAHALLSRKLGTAMAERIIQSNDTYTAQQMYDLGIVHHLAEPGEGLAVCREFIKRATRRHAGLVAERKAMRTAAPLTLDELNRITELWAEAALQLRDQDLKVMNRLANAQRKLARAA